MYSIAEIDFVFQIQTMNEQKADTQVDYDKLADFLKRVTPGILEALDETYGSNAFDDYDPNVTEASATNVELLKKISISKEPDTQVLLISLLGKDQITGKYAQFYIVHFT